MTECIEKPDMQYILHIKSDKKAEKRLIDFCLESVVDVFEDTGLTADVQPVKHGRWITWDDSGFTKCSCCNSEYYISDLQVVGDSEGFVGFCPNCGARMDGEQV